MNKDETAKLIRSLLGADLGAETRAEIEAFQRDLEADTLHEDDVDYVVALASRLGVEGAPPMPVRPVEEAIPDEDEHVEDSEGESLEAVLSERDALRERVAELETELASLRAAAARSME